MMVKYWYFSFFIVFIMKIYTFILSFLFFLIVRRGWKFLKLLWLFKSVKLNHKYLILFSTIFNDLKQYFTDMILYFILPLTKTKTHSSVKLKSGFFILVLFFFVFLLEIRFSFRFPSLYRFLNLREVV